MIFSFFQQSVQHSRGAQCRYSDEAVVAGVVATLHETLRSSRVLGFCFLAVVLLQGCGQDHPAASGQSAPRKHEHIPPHHGTPVVLGNEEYHLELVRDASAGELHAYLLDGEMENFIRIQQPSFEAKAKLPAGEESLIFKAVPNTATGETIGDTSLFEAQSDWIKTTTNFDGAITELNVRGTAYRNVSFNFPKGNDTDEK